MLTASKGDLTECVEETGSAWSGKQMVSRGGRTMDGADRSTGMTAYKTEDDDNDDYDLQRATCVSN